MKTTLTGGRLRKVLAATALACLALPALASAEPSAPVAVPGKPTLMLGAFDLAALGYRTEEYFLSGTAELLSPAGRTGGGRKLECGGG